MEYRPRAPISAQRHLVEPLRKKDPLTSHSPDSNPEWGPTGHLVSEGTVAGSKTERRQSHEPAARCALARAEEGTRTS